MEEKVDKSTASDNNEGGLDNENGASLDKRGQSALTTAAEFIKYTTALSTGALVFSAELVKEDFQLSTSAKILLILSWAAFFSSAFAGILAYSRIPVQIIEKNYNLEDKFFVWPGRIHQIGFLVGVLLLGITLSITLLGNNGADALISITPTSSPSFAPTPTITPSLMWTPTPILTPTP